MTIKAANAFMEKRVYVLRVGTDAGKPAAGTAGRFYWATDTEILYRDTGSAWEETARGESVTRLDQLSEKAHGSLTGATADQHHPQSHALASHSTKAHTELTDVTADQHHAESHNAASHLDIASTGANIDDAVAKKHTLPATDPAVGTGGLRTLGAGAQQAAAGNHAHTLSQDILASAVSANQVMSAYGAGRYQRTITAGTSWSAVTRTSTFASGSLAVGAASSFANGTYLETFKFRLIMGGVQVAETGWLVTVLAYVILMATRALSGSQSTVGQYHNYSGTDRAISFYGSSGASHPIAVAVTHGSVKV